MVDEDESLPYTLRDAIRALVEWTASYDEHAIEIAARNLAVTDGEGAHPGTLILLDPCYSYKEVREKQDAARRRARGY